MHQKLRRKIAGTVALVAALLVLACVCVYAAAAISKNNQAFIGGLRWEAVRGMSHAVRESVHPKRTDIVEYVMLAVRADGQVSYRNENTSLDLLDCDTPESVLIADTLAAPEECGIMPEHGVLYYRLYHGGTWYMTFANVSARQAQTSGILWRCGAFYAGALAVILLFSVSLSYWVTKPVKKAWESQQRFIADASHTLKTPLSIISANAELLRPSLKGEQDLSRLDNIAEETKNTLSLVDELLSLEELSRPPVGEALAPVDLSLLATEASLRFEGLAIERGVPFDSVIEDELCVSGDRELLLRLLFVLLDNALKYVRPGGHIRLECRGGASHEAVVTVANTHESIPQERLSRVFERFYQLDSAPGHGLGLSIAQGIADYHKGRLFAESKNGEVLFSLSLPRAYGMER